MVMQVEVEGLVASLEEAFHGVRRGAIFLHEADVVDSYGSAAERLAARAFDPEEDWRDIPSQAIEACANALPHLDPVSWRFYLPAFMRHGLRHLKDSHQGIIDRVIYTLAPGDDPQLARYHAERYALLDAAQIGVVRRVLAFATRHGDHCDDVVAQQALDGYWSEAAV